MTVDYLAAHLKKSIPYEDFHHRFEKTVLEIRSGALQDEKSEYYLLNWQRSTRNEKTFRLSEALRKYLEEFNKTVTWLIITEPWCGDSAQTLAGLQGIAAASNGKINLRICYRDEDTSLIDQFLTHGARSIPKLVQLDSNGKVSGTWGPRPKDAQELVLRLKSDPATAANYAEELHKWYAKDHMESLQREIEDLLNLA